MNTIVEKLKTEIVTLDELRVQRALLMHEQAMATEKLDRAIRLHMSKLEMLIQMLK